MRSVIATSCAANPVTCCLTAYDLLTSQDIYFPENAYIGGSFSYLDNDGNKVSFDPEEVSIQHYTPSVLGRSDFQFYFKPRKIHTGYYEDQIHWKKGEIDEYGQRLAVCATQNSDPGPTGSAYTLEIFVAIPA